MANKTRNQQPIHSTNSTSPTSGISAGVVSTGASSHTDPGSYRHDDSNPAQDLDLNPNLAARPRNSWIEGVNQLPQQVKEWSNKAVDQVSSLSTTQKVVGSALLLGGIGWLSWRAKNNSANSDDSSYDAVTSARPWGSANRTEIDEQFQPVTSYRSGLAGDTILE
ncbi:hypothetical protein MUN82_15825 [Hymenobacter aerilatus]|uniref:Uncharacterized protein n=1 Tax=Hymenobacter aerilatus TaxID=2932251 RepID=A0A8T9SUJ6_9BACT|nr:hypothetical protein [Hymenobacter aerilatus]UOR04403.1 hypothetical protein MUN82_15825 [Hymenobacter aerilatus]